MIHLIFGLPACYVVARTLWPLPWPVPLKLLLAGAILAGSQFHYWNRLSSGSIFAPEYPRILVILFNWSIGAVLLLSALQVLLDGLSVGSRLLPGAGWAIPHGWRYAAASLAMLVAAVAVWQAIRVPPVKDVEVRVRNLPAAFDGYRLLQLTDLHASRLFPASWIRAVVARSSTLGVDLIVGAHGRFKVDALGLEQDTRHRHGLDVVLRGPVGTLRGGRVDDEVVKGRRYLLLSLLGPPSDTGLAPTLPWSPA